MRLISTTLKSVEASSQVKESQIRSQLRIEVPYTHVVVTDEQHRIPLWLEQLQWYQAETLQQRARSIALRER